MMCKCLIVTTELEDAAKPLVRVNSFDGLAIVEYLKRGGCKRGGPTKDKILKKQNY